MKSISNSLKERLKTLGINIAGAPPPGGSYVSVNVRGNIAYVAIQFPIHGNRYLYQGKLGLEISTAQGCQAAKLTGINILAQMEKYVGFDKVVGLNHVDIYYQASEEWDEGPLIADGASDLFGQILEDRGKHSRAILGVHKLPRNFCVGISCTFTLAGS